MAQPNNAAEEGIDEGEFEDIEATIAAMEVNSDVAINHAHLEI